MGAAMDWFGENERRSIAEGLLSGVRENGGRLWADCPFHNEDTKGGSFFYDPAKDHAFCFSCRASWDLIGVFCVVSGYAPDAPDGFREFRSRFAPGRPLQAATPHRAEPKRPAVWMPKPESLPPSLWSEKAEEFIRKSMAHLTEHPAEMERLAVWGISADTAAKCRIGWNDKDRYVLRSAWGLPKELKPDGKERRLWFPEGLVLPFYVDGKPARIKIRRPHPETGPEQLRDMRYYQVVGGSKRLFRYGKPSCPVWVVVESERDAAMVWGLVRDLGIGAIGTGSASARPDADLVPKLADARCILVAFDNDDAGAVQSVWWLEHFPLAIRWPVPPAGGKDPGDAIGQGLDIRAWALAGLPGHVRSHLDLLARHRGQTIVPGSTPPPVLSAPADPEPAPAQTTPAGYPEIPGLDFRDELLADLWNLLADQPGALGYFRLLGLFSIYPARGVRVRKAKAEAMAIVEQDGIALRMDERWVSGNRAMARQISELFWDDKVFSLWLDWDWNKAPVEIEKGEAA